MTLTRSRVIAGASGYAGEPPDEPLPTGVPMWLRFEIVAEIETELLRDVNQSVQNRTMAKVSIRLNPGQREFSLPQSGLENPAYISLTRSDNPALVPLPVEIGNLALIDRDAQEGRRTAAFYSDKPQRGILSWLPGDNETLLVWYDRTPNTDPSPDQQTFTITDSYVSLIKLMAGAQMLELLQRPVGAVLAARIQRGMKQWQDFVDSGRQQGVVEKSVGYSGSHNRAGISQWDAWPGRVNFE